MGPMKGYGLIAKQDLRIEEDYCKLPAEGILHSFIEYPWRSYFANADPRVRLIAYIIYQKFENREPTFHQQYIAWLDEDFNAVYSWSESEISELRKIIGVKDLYSNKFESY
jgi:hypothetical protein